MRVESDRGTSVEVSHIRHMPGLRRLALWVGAVLAALSLAAWLLLRTFDAAPRAAAPPPDLNWPAAHPPPEMSLVWLPTGVIHRKAGVAYRGGSFSEAWDSTMTAVLVKHPSGDVLIDTGLGRNIDTQFASMPWVFREFSPLEKGRPAADQLAAAGYDFARLRAILLTHAHWDHVSGISDFPETPVWLTEEEKRFVVSGSPLTAVARSAGVERYRTYAFEGGPYLGFPKSHDVYGDGSLVVVPAPGHTPGSVIVFVTLPSQTHYAFIGDLAWHRRGIQQREEKPWLIRTLVDTEPAQVRSLLQQMSALSQRFPDLITVPAHDADNVLGGPRPQGAAPKSK